MPNPLQIASNVPTDGRELRFMIVAIVFSDAFSYVGSAEKALRQQKPQYIKYPLSFLHKIWYNTHIADDPKIGAFYQKTANLRGA